MITDLSVPITISLVFFSEILCSCSTDKTILAVNGDQYTGVRSLNFVKGIKYGQAKHTLKIFLL